MCETTPTFDDIRFAVSQFSSGNSDIRQANSIITSFMSLPDNAQLPTIALMIKNHDPILSVYGWKLVDRIIKNTNLKSELRVEIEQFVEVHYSDKLEDENVCLMKASAIASLLSTNFNEKKIIPLLEFMNSKSLNDINHSVLEIMIWKSFICMTMENETVSNSFKNVVRKTLLSKIIPNTVNIVESWRLKGTGGDKLFSSYAAFVRTIPSIIQITGSTEALNHLFKELLLIIKNRENFSQSIFIEIIEAYIPLFLVRNKFMNEVLMTKQFVHQFLEIWNVVNFENSTVFCQLSEATLDIIYAFSDFLALSARQRTAEYIELSNIWISNFRLSKVMNVRVISQILRSLKTLVELTHQGYEKLLEVLFIFKKAHIFNTIEFLENESFWNVSFDALRVLFRASNSPASIINHVYMDVLEYVLRFPTELSNQSQVMLEKFFKTTRCISHIENVDCGSILFNIYNKLTKKIMDYRAFISNENLISSFDNIIFYVKLKYAISCALYKSEGFRFALFDDIVMSLELMKLGVAFQNRELLYILCSYVHSLVDANFEYLQKMSSTKRSDYNNGETNLENIVDLMVSTARELSPLQKVPLLECIILLNNTNSFAQEQLQWIKDFKHAESFEEFMNDQLGFNTENPLEEQILKRKDYRGYLTMLRAYFKRASQSEREHLVHELHKPFLKLLCFYNSWKKYKKFANVYNTSLTRNEKILLGLDGSTISDEHIPVDTHPNTFFESLGDIIFQVADYMVASGLRNYVNVSPARELFLECLKPCVHIMGISYRKWMTKGFRSLIQALNKESATQCDIEEILYQYCESSSEIINMYSKQQNIPEDDLASTDPNTFEAYHLVQRFALDTASCTSQIFGNDEDLLIGIEGNVVYKKREEKHFSDFTEAILLNPVTTQTLFNYFSLFRNVNYDFFKVYCKLITHFLYGGSLIKISKEMELQYYTSIFQSICLTIISNCDDEESIPMLLKLIKVAYQTSGGHQGLFYQALQFYSGGDIRPPSINNQKNFNEMEKWAKFIVETFVTVQSCRDEDRMEQ